MSSWTRSRRSNEFLCIGGPRDGEFHPITIEGYVQYNRSSRLGSVAKRDPSAVLIWRKTLSHE